MTESFPENYKDRIIGLDILRTVAIIWVVYVHGAMHFYHTRWIKLYNIINPIKIDGVSIFFVLSGFLIGGILLRILRNRTFTKRDLFNFWIRRWFRTIPNYMLVLTVLLIIYKVIGVEVNNKFLSYYFFSQNFWSPHPRYFEEAWSLSVEEWFYLLFPVVCYLIFRLTNNTIRSFLFSTCLFLLIPLALRVMVYDSSWDESDFNKDLRKIVIYRLDSLMYGMLGAYLSITAPQLWRRYRHAFMLIGVLLYVLVTYKNIHNTPVYFTIESLIVLCFLPYLSTLKSSGNTKLDRVFIFISVISYSLYLVHSTLINNLFLPFIVKLFSFNRLPVSFAIFLNYSLYWILSILLSYFIYTHFERPITSIRDRL